MIRLPYLMWRKRYSPIVTTRLLSQEKSVTTLAFLDTGATYSVFQGDFCERLGLTLEEGERVGITVGDGGIILVYLHELKVSIDELSFDTRIGFSDRLGTGINILGRETVMDEFVICFDGPNREVRWEC